MTFASFANKKVPLTWRPPSQPKPVKKALLEPYPPGTRIRINSTPDICTIRGFETSISRINGPWYYVVRREGLSLNDGCYSNNIIEVLD
jgi:hypothetical protein